MLDIRWIRDNPETLVEALCRRGQAAESARGQLDAVLAADEARRAHLTKLQEAQERRNAASKEIGRAMGAGDGETAARLKAEVAELKGFVQEGEAHERVLDGDLRELLAAIPNVPLDDVPVGPDESANVEIRRHGEAARPSWAREHFELGEALGQMDFERAAKLSGARFTVLSGGLARLERALGQFMLDLHTQEHGYTEVQPPLLVRDEALFGTGQLPKFEEDLFKTEAEALKEGVLQFGPEDGDMQELNELFRAVFERQEASTIRDRIQSIWPDDFHRQKEVKEHFLGRRSFYLIPTAEVPLTNLVREEIVEAERLPLRYTALTPCFRSEAGSAGRDTRGMLRQHQFDKVELVSITDADSALEEHERMTACAETVLRKLGLPFRTVVLSTGDMGFAAQKTHDIEVWLPGQDAFREISSCSVCGDFQARRMNARYRGADRQTRHVHTLNGSGVAVGRALIAVMENYQDEDGAIAVPDVLKPYMGGMTRIERAEP